MTSLLSLLVPPPRIADRLKPYSVEPADPWDPAKRWPFARPAVKPSPAAAAPERPHSPQSAAGGSMFAMSVLPASWGQKVEMSK